MAKIVPFTSSMSRTCGATPKSFVDDGDLLEFPGSENAQTGAFMPAHDPAPSQPARPRTRYAKSFDALYASDWSNQELANLHRAFSLVQSAQPGLEYDRGISDEGDPWFIIGDDKGEVLIHICRIDGRYILDGAALSNPLNGKDFNALIEDFLTSVVGKGGANAETSTNPANVVRLARGGTVCLHPSMMIAALVWALLMNADELSLPPSDGSSSAGRNRDENDDPGIHPGIHPGMPAAEAFSAELVSPEKSEAAAGDLPLDQRVKETIALRDEKHLQVSAHSHALTTVAIAAGFFASAEAANVFWKSLMEASADASVSVGETEASEANELVAPLDHLADALALLSNVVDLVAFEGNETYAAENANAAGDSAEILAPAALAAMEAGETKVAMEGNIGQQMFAKASEVSKSVAEMFQARRTDASGETVEIIENAPPQDAGMSGSMQSKEAGLPAKEQALDDSIQGIAQAYTSSDVQVIHYDTASFMSGLDKYNGELQKYFEAYENVSLLTEDESPLASETADDSLVSSSFKTFDDAARRFIESKIANYEVEILVFEEEIVFVDKAAFSEGNTTISWQLEDGNLVSMIGLSADMADFLIA